MPLDASLPTGDSIQNLGDPMADVILHNVTHKPACKKNSDYRIHQIQIVGFRRIEIIC